MIQMVGLIRFEWLQTVLYVSVSIVYAMSSLHSPHIDVRDKYSLTPLHYACTGGSIEVVQYLVIMLKCNFG